MASPLFKWSEAPKAPTVGGAEGADEFLPNAGRNMSADIFGLITDIFGLIMDLSISDSCSGFLM